MNLSRFKNLNINQQIMLSAGLFLLVCVFIYLLIVNTVGDIKELKTAIVAQKVDVETQASRETSLVKAGESLKQIEPQLEKFDRIFINNNRELEFITALEEIADKNNIKQKINLSSTAEDDKYFYKKTPLYIDAQGTFYNLMKYLTDMETLDYYITIGTIDFASSPVASRVAQRRTVTDEGEVLEEAPNIVILKIAAETYWK